MLLDLEAQPRTIDQPSRPLHGHKRGLVLLPIQNDPIADRSMIQLKWHLVKQLSGVPSMLTKHKAARE